MRAENPLNLITCSKIEYDLIKLKRGWMSICALNVHEQNINAIVKHDFGAFIQ